MPDIQSFRLTPEECVLLIVDVQERLMAAMPEDVRPKIISHIQILAEGAKRLNLPVVATEQYPKGLGPTMGEISESLPDWSPFEKVVFSCCGAEGFMPHLRKLGRTKVLLTGSETHVCCYQTALDLIEHGFIVHAIADAMCSRTKLNWQTGLKAMELAGALPATTEQVLLELLRTAGTDNFKAISRLIR